VRTSLRGTRTLLVLTALAAGGGLACIGRADGRSANMASAVAKANEGHLCEAALAVVKEEANAPAGRRSVQSTSAYAHVRDAWRDAVGSLRGQCRLRFAVHPKVVLPWTEMHVYAELDFAPVADAPVPKGVETPLIFDRAVAAGAHVAYVEFVAIAADPPHARITTGGWTRLPCPGASVDITFELNAQPPYLTVTAVPPQTWDELRIAAPCRSEPIGPP
jgi:hypothetical protein